MAEKVEVVTGALQVMVGAADDDDDGLRARAGVAAAIGG